MNQQVITFYEHILEIRKRLFYVVSAFLVGSILGFVFYSDVQAALIEPLGQQLYYTSPTGGFSFMFSLSLFAGALLAIPFVVYHIILFLSPTIGRNRTLFAYKLLGGSIFLTITGVCFAYFVTLPPTLNFLTGFNSETISSLISTNEYLSFIKLYLAAFALIFQIPLILLVINSIWPIDPKSMLKTQKYVIAGSFIAAAIISPTPDAMNQVLMAAPMIVLYELSIGFIWIANKRKFKKARSLSSAKTKHPESPNTPFDYLAKINDFDTNVKLSAAKTEAATIGSGNKVIANKNNESVKSISGIIHETSLRKNQSVTMARKNISIEELSSVPQSATKAADPIPSKLDKKIDISRGRVQPRTVYAKRSAVSDNTRSGFTEPSKPQSLTNQRKIKRFFVDDINPRRMMTTSY